MKKIFLIAFLAIMAFNFYSGLKYEDTQSKPYTEFKKQIDVLPMNEYHDPTFGYSIKYPSFFQQEDTSLSDYQGYARFSYTNNTNVILESYVTSNHSKTIQACADSLTKKLHADKTIIRKDSSFILSGPVYENNVRVDGYSHYDKFIKNGKMLFVFSLTYPDNYKPAMTKLLKQVEDWRVFGAN